MIQFLYSLLAFLATVSVLIAFHEYGHFVAARRCGVRVLRFSIGIGPVVWRREDAEGTEWVVSALPLGGYVRMLDEREGDVPEQELARAFNRKPLRQRCLIVLAGPVFNLLAAVLAFTLVYMIGVTGLRPVVEDVLPDSPAARAGLAPGQEFFAVAGRPVASWRAVNEALLRPLIAGAPAAELSVGASADDRYLVTLPLDGLSLDTLSRETPLELIGILPRLPAPKAVFDTVEPGSPAARAGLLPGDQVVAAAGRPVLYWQDFSRTVREHPAGASLSLQLLRQGQPLSVDLIPARAEEGQGRIGVGLRTDAARLAELRRELERVESYSLFPALGRALQRTWDISALTLRVLGQIVVGRVSADNLSGPVGIAYFAGLSALQGLSSFFAFLAVVSIGLGIFNLLPIPILDGGHLLYYLIEYLKGSPLSDVQQAAGQRVGLFLLLGLFLLVCYNDFLRLA